MPAGGRAAWPGYGGVHVSYLTYKPHIGIPESKRTVISNIHRQGTTAVEAGAHIAELIKTMLEKKASGIDLR